MRTVIANVGRLALMLVAGSIIVGGLEAQTPAPARQADAATRLPVRRVVLYKSGVGYFEHLGQVTGNENVTIEFTSGQLNDVLKSLTTLDLDGGRVAGVSYNSEESIGRRLGALRLPVGEQTTRAAFLSALRGARLEVRSGSGPRVTGRLLSVERVAQPSGTGVVETDVLSLVTDAGDIHSVALDPGVTVRIAESDLNEEVGRYLSLIASVRDQDVRRLTIATTGTGARDLFVSYVSEVPVWKSTYRLVLPNAGDGRQPLLQGWAVVDNTVGEDWERVELSLVAGAPQSFIQQISQPYYVQRPVVPLPERALLAPQTHQAGLGTAGAGAMAGTVTDANGGLLPGVTVRVVSNGATVGQATTGSDGRFQIPGVPPGRYDVTFALPGFQTLSRPGVNITGGMESVLNAALQIGGLSEEMTVMAEAPASRAGAGRGGGGGGALGYVAAPPPPAAPSRNFDSFEAMKAQQSQAVGAELGDLFEYKLTEPVTIRRNQSALVPIVSGSVAAEKVSLFTPSAPAGRPLRALWLTNSTGLTLDGGSFTVVEGQAFAGEGLIEPLKPGEKRLLSYATDLGMQVTSTAEPTPSRITRVQISRGVLIQHTEERQRRVYTARNEDAEPRVLIVEHPMRADWTLEGDVKPEESTAGWHRYRIAVAPRTTATFAVEETHPIQAQFRVSSISEGQIALWVTGKHIDPATEAALREVQTRQAALAALGRDIAAREAEIKAIGADQERVRENMRSLKGSSEERTLLQRYVRQLTDQENRLEVLRAEIATLAADRAQAQAALNQFIDGLSGGGR